MWGKVRLSAGRQDVRTSWEIPVDATWPDKEGGKLGALEYDGMKGIREPREIKWGLSHEEEFFPRSSFQPSCCCLGIFLHVTDFFPPEHRLCPHSPLRSPSGSAVGRERVWRDTHTLCTDL